MEKQEKTIEQKFIINEQIYSKIKKIKNLKELIEFISQNEKLQVEKYINRIIKENFKIVKEINSSKNETHDALIGNIMTEYESSLFRALTPMNIEDNEKDFSQRVSEFFFNFYMFFTKENNQIINKIINMLTLAFSKIQKYKTKGCFLLKEQLRYSARDNVMQINMRLVSSYVDNFEIIEIINENKYLSNYVNEIIEKSDSKILENVFKHMDIIFKKGEISEYGEILKHLNHPILIERCLEEKSLFPFIKKLIKFHPEHISDIVTKLLHYQDTKTACELIKDNRSLISEDLFTQVLNVTKLKSFSFHYGRFYKYELDLPMLIELFENDYLIYSKLASLLIKHNMFAECYYLLKKFHFSTKIELSSREKKDLKNHLLNNYGQNTFYPDGDYAFYIKFSNNKYLNINYPDFFGPYDEKCLKLKIKENTIKVLDKPEDFHFLDVFFNSEFIGIDCEWKPRMSSLDIVDRVATMQLADEKNAIIVDMIKLSENEEFLEKFKKFFIDKTFVGFSFKSDLSVLHTNFREFFLKCKFEDITEMYKKKFETKSPGLTDVCDQILSKKLCKFEQISNWEIRPLRKRQIHYACLDANVLITLFHKLK